jgi:purine nucleosidase/pyrimidine-specific ribonucleoside hydrolase
MWTRLGVLLVLVACLGAGQSAVVLAGNPPIPVIFDDDGSPDATIALMFLLRNPAIDLKALTVNGEAHPSLFARNLVRALTRVGHASIPVAAGPEFPLQGNNAFPENWRAQSDAFWGLTLPSAVTQLQPISAAQLIVNTVKASPQPITILATGTFTNVAQALRLDRTITCNIREIVIMGGAIYVPGNIASDAPGYTNTVSEWNIWVDPIAASEVFVSGIPMHLVPLDATDDVVWTAQDAAVWKASGTPEGVLAGELLDMLLQWWSPSGVYIWDLDTAAVVVDETLCPGQRLHVDVITTKGADEGRTVARSDVAANMIVCLRLNSVSVKNAVKAVLGQ